jgi:hypothetical protein
MAVSLTLSTARTLLQKSGFKYTQDNTQCPVSLTDNYRHLRYYKRTDYLLSQESIRSGRAFQDDSPVHTISQPYDASRFSLSV